MEAEQPRVRAVVEMAARVHPRNSEARRVSAQQEPKVGPQQRRASRGDGGSKRDVGLPRRQRTFANVQCGVSGV